MRVKDYNCKCGHGDFFFADKGNQKGIYCSYCGKWFKWADKDEQNLSMKQEPILDKIQDDIEKINGILENHITKSDVLQIIEKYKEESEHTND